MPQTSFQLDEGTAKAIAELKGVFGVRTSTAVIRRAIAASRIAARNASADDTVTLVDKAGAKLTIMLKS